MVAETNIAANQVWKSGRERKIIKKGIAKGKGNASTNINKWKKMTMFPTTKQQFSHKK